MARRFRRGARRFRRGTVSLLWTGNSTATPQTVLAGPANTLISNLVVPADYQQGATGSTEPGAAVLMRIRGGVSYHATTLTGSVYFSLIEHSQAAVPFTPNTAAAIFDGNVLWTHMGNPPNDANDRYVEIDVRVKRKLENSIISLMVETVVNSAVVSFWTRCLLKLP